MEYILGKEYIQLDESQGVIQNLSTNIAELTISADLPTSLTPGLYINSNNMFSFKVPDGKHAYMRCRPPWEYARVIVEDCANFKQPASSSGGAGCTIDDAIKSTNKTWSSKKISDTIGTSGSGSSSAGYTQITKLGVVAPKQIDIPIQSTNTFCLPAIEVLKFTPGAQDQVVTACDFNNADAGDFVASDRVTFNGTMRLKTQHEIAMSDPVALEDGFVSESEWIDFADYKAVEEVG